MKIDTIVVTGQREDTTVDEWKFTSRRPLPIGYEPYEPKEKEEKEEAEDVPSDEGYIPPTQLAKPESSPEGVLGFMAPAGRLMPFDDVVTVTASRMAVGRVAAAFIPIVGIAIGAVTLAEVTESLAAVAGEAVAEHLNEEISRQVKAAHSAITVQQRGDGAVIQLTPETFLPFAEDTLRVARERMHRLGKERVISQEWEAAYHETMFQAYEDRIEFERLKRGHYQSDMETEEESMTVQDQRTRAHIMRSRKVGWDMWQMDIYPEVKEQKFRRGHYKSDEDQGTDDMQDILERLRLRLPQELAVELPDLTEVLRPEMDWLPQSRLDLNLKRDSKGLVKLEVKNQTRLRSPLKQWEQSVKEGRTPRKDAKSRSMQRYLAAMRFVSKTWGRASEWLDRANAAQSNLYVEPGTYYLDGHRFYIRKRTRFDSLTVRQRRDALQGMYEGRIRWSFDELQFMMDVFVMEATDRAIAAGGRAEEQVMRKLFSDAHPLRNMYGNPSTWASRINKLGG